MFFQGILLVLLAAECYSQSDSKSACDRFSQPEYVNETSGWIASPNYPGNYANNLDCRWLITAALPTEVVSIYFTNFYTIWCCDYVNVHDGDNVFANDIVNGYGYVPLYRVYTTTQPYMLIRFVTDGSLVTYGFYAVFYTGNNTDSSTPQDSSATTDVPATADELSTTTRYELTATYPENFPLACRASLRPEVINNSTGLITSPNYPGPYYNNLDCRWLITSMFYEVVHIYFTDFLTEECCDYVYIHNGNNVFAPVIASLRGRAPLYVVYSTTQPNMLVRFTTDYSVVYYGFYAVFYTGDGITGITWPEQGTTETIRRPTTEGTSSLPLACDARYRPENIQSSPGWITSPNFPGYYYNNLDCQWLIFATSFNEVVSLSFTYFYIEPNNDFVYIYDGRYDYNQLIVVLTGLPDVINVTYTTTQYYMLVKFTSNNIATYPGFNATYWSTQAGWLTTAASGSSTTTTWFTTAALTTSQPSAPVIDPRPYVAVKLNGTMTATGSITQSCSDAFSADFRNSFQEVVGRANNLVANGQLCSDGGGPLRIVAGQIQSLFIGTAGQTVFSILVGPNPPDWVTLQTDESCSWQVSDFVRNGNNWRQPIISNIFGCPTVAVDSNSFTWQQSFWDVF